MDTENRGPAYLSEPRHGVPESLKQKTTEKEEIMEVGRRISHSVNLKEECHTRVRKALVEEGRDFLSFLDAQSSICSMLQQFFLQTHCEHWFLSGRLVPLSLLGTAAVFGGICNVAGFQVCILEALVSLPKMLPSKLI